MHTPQHNTLFFHFGIYNYERFARVCASLQDLQALLEGMWVTPACSWMTVGCTSKTRCVYRGGRHRENHNSRDV